MRLSSGNFISLTRAFNSKRKAELKLALANFLVYYAVGVNALSQILHSINSFLTSTRLLGGATLPSWAIAGFNPHDPLLYVCMRLILFTGWILVLFALIEVLSVYFQRGSELANMSIAASIALFSFPAVNWIASKLLLVSLPIVLISFSSIFLILLVVRQFYTDLVKMLTIFFEINEKSEG